MSLLKTKAIGIVALLSLGIFAASPAFAQGGVGSTRGLPDSAAGIHTIQGRVYGPDGRRAGAGVIIKLDGNVNGTHTIATDSDGTFVFTSLPAAEYTLVVDGGDQFEVLSQPVTIYGTTGGVGMGRSGQTIQVDLHLRPKGAAAAEAKLFEGAPKAAMDLYNKGMHFVKENNPKKAVEQFNAALAIYPNFIPALRNLGIQYLSLKEMDKVVETSERLIKLSPTDARAHLNLGIALYNQKKFPEAETELRQVVKLNPTDPAAHYYLGMTLVNLKQYQEAESELELAIKNGGDNLALAHRYLGGLYMSSRKNEQAAVELEKYLKLDPKAADADKIKETIKTLRSKP
jgi:Flp pilus assembly protein TadD